MKSLVSAVNVTGEAKVMGGITFPPATPVVVYRNADFFGNPEAVGLFISDVAVGEIVGYTFNGSANTPDESIEVINFLMNQIELMKQIPSYSFEYHWNMATCKDMVDGLKKQLDQFDWTPAEVTIKKADFYVTAHTVVTALLAGYLDIATTLLGDVPAESDPEFFTAERKGQFLALFNSALVV